MNLLLSLLTDLYGASSSLLILLVLFYTFIRNHISIHKNLLTFISASISAIPDLIGNESPLEIITLFFHDQFLLNIKPIKKNCTFIR